MEIKSRVPAMVEKINVKEGDSVSKMDILVELEAMKMIQKVPSPIDGEVSEICIEEGEKVKAGQVMMIIE